MKHQCKLNLMCDFSSSSWGKDSVQKPIFAQFVLCMFLMQLKPSAAGISPVSLPGKIQSKNYTAAKCPVLWVVPRRWWPPLLVLLQTLLEPLHLLKLNSSVLSSSYSESSLSWGSWAHLCPLSFTRLAAITGKICHVLVPWELKWKQN